MLSGVSSGWVTLVPARGASATTTRAPARRAEAHGSHRGATTPVTRCHAPVVRTGPDDLVVLRSVRVGVSLHLSDRVSPRGVARSVGDKDNNSRCDLPIPCQAALRASSLRPRSGRPPRLRRVGTSSLVLDPGQLVAGPGERP